MDITLKKCHLIKFAKYCQFFQFQCRFLHQTTIYNKAELL